MSNTIIKNKTISTRVTPDISERAKANLAKQGLTVSEYIRLSLVKAANNEVIAMKDVAARYVNPLVNQKYQLNHFHSFVCTLFY